MGKKAKTPAMPDPAATAAAQTALNKETAYWNASLNNVNQITPYGSLTYVENRASPDIQMDQWEKALADYDATGGWTELDGKGRSSADPRSLGMSVFDRSAGKAPSFTSTIKLSPEQQKLYDTTTASDNALASLGYDQIGRIKESVSTPYSYSGLTSANDYATAAENAIYSRLNPQFQRDEESMRTRLINQGIGQGSQAYQREMDTFNQMKNDARMQSILTGQQYGLTGRNQEISEYNAQRNAPLNEYNALTSGAQVTNPSFMTPNYQGAQAGDYAGAVNQNYQNQMAQYNANQASKNNTMSSLFGLGGSFLSASGAAGGIGSLFAGLSDARLKTNIELFGKENGFPIYKFNYDQTHPYVRHINLPDKQFIGVMAQDIENMAPEAVSEVDGYKRVNYSMIGVEMREVA